MGNNTVLVIMDMFGICPFLIYHDLQTCERRTTLTFIHINHGRRVLIVYLPFGVGWDCIG